MSGLFFRSLLVVLGLLWGTGAAGGEIVLLSCNDAATAQKLANKLPNAKIGSWSGEVRLFDNGFVEGDGSYKLYQKNTPPATITTPPNGGKTSKPQNGKMVRLGDEVVSLNIFKNKLVSRLQSSTGFTLKHTDVEITQIINKGKELGLTDDVIEDMLFISCRDAKEIASIELMTQMDNWVNVVSKQGFPYKFTDLGQFNQFKNELKTGLNDIGVSTSDVRIQGSALRTPNADDVDMVAIINKNEFENLLKSFYNGKIKKNNIDVDISNLNSQQLKTLSDDINQNPFMYNGTAKSDFNYNYTKQIINAKPDKGVIDGLKNLKDNLQSKYPNLNVKNIAIQTNVSMFDLKPFMKL